MNASNAVDSDDPSPPAGASAAPLAPADVRAYLARRWDAAQAAKHAYWAHEFHDRGAEVTLAASLALWQHMRAVRPDWPTHDDRRDDLDHHIALKRLIDHAARAIGDLSAR